MPCRFLNCFYIQWFARIKPRIVGASVSALKHLPFKRA